MGSAYKTFHYLVQGSLTGVAYRDNILQPLVLPVLQALGPGAILQDNSARLHRARVVSDFPQQHKVNSIDWQACFPELNPIEHYGISWANQLPAAGLNQLYQFFQHEW